MAHVERAGDIWRMDNYRKYGRVWVLIDFRGEATLLLPARVMMLFRLFGIVLFRDVHHLFRRLEARLVPPPLEIES